MKSTNQVRLTTVEQFPPLELIGNLKTGKNCNVFNDFKNGLL